MVAAISECNDVTARLHRIDLIEHPQGRRIQRSWAAAHIADPLGVDPAREVAAQRLAASAGLAPEVFAFDRGARTMQMAFVPGVALEIDWLRRPARREAMQDLLSRLARLAPIDLPRLDLAERLRALHFALSARAPIEADRLAEELDAVLHEAAGVGVFDPAAASQACLVHGDVTPLNTRVCPDGSLVLIDWEYAHAGHPLEDLAGLIAQVPIDEPSAPAAQADFSGFEGATDHSLAVRVRLRRLLDVLWKAVVSTSAGVSPAG